MDFKLSDREELLRKSIREWAEKEIPPYMEAMEETGEFPVELIKPMADMGINGVVTPQEYGGTGMGHLARVIVLEELGRVCPAIPMSMQVHHMCTYALDVFGNDEQKKKYLPGLAQGETLGVLAVTDPSGGSDLAGMQTSAKLEGDKYILNGRKCFITNAHVSDTWVIIAKTGEGRKALSAFIVEKDFPGVKLGRKEDKVGLRGANTGELVFQDAEVPAENLLGQEGDGMTIALRGIVECGRPGMASVGLGILNASLEEAVKFANERTAYGQPISRLQQIQVHLAGIYSDLELARLAAYRVGWMVDQGMRVDAESALAKSFACEAAVRSARRAIEIHGSYGIMKEYAVQRLLRDAVVTIPAGGTSEIAKIVLGRAALSAAS
ncbi:MAG: acyl-CoA dehydrogenase family protein [Deltaproteobacteria bacterium]|nr:acyl-CoA dehydrogenase family protein [Deltaproteobacteria bacterium]MBW2051894.1 acyl-CoA dehydrogenase family protein [Deltaproteobacteria bacterium]